MRQKFSTIAYFTVLEAMRNRLVYLAALIVAIAFAFTLLLKQVAITESGQIQIAFLAALFRFVAVFIVAAFVVVSQVREANDKVLDFLLTRELSRDQYLFGKLAGYLAVALIVAILFTLPICFFAAPAAATWWGMSLFLELAMVTAMCLFCVLTFNQVIGALAAFAGFYLLSRSMAALQLIAASRDGAGAIDRVANTVLDAIAFLLPRLDLFTRTEWLLANGTVNFNLRGLLAQSAIYVVLLSLAALFDLRRKNF